jgi:hypothetical protein
MLRSAKSYNGEGERGERVRRAAAQRSRCTTAEQAAGGEPAAPSLR